MMSTVYKLPLVLDPQPEGGFVVSCSILPELVTEGETVQEALKNANDALGALIEAFKSLGKPLPQALQPAQSSAPLWLETILDVS
jgi:antitoxin HicB